MKKLYILLSLTFVSFTSSAQVVISQVYGGGGNAGAPYTNDFIELFNRGTVAQNLNGWSVQYTSSAGPTGALTPFWITTRLPNFNLQPGQYYLIQQAAGTIASAALPTPDFIGSTQTLDSNGTASPNSIPMSASGGKVILVNVPDQQTGANPTGPQIIDKVGYGTAATGFEGSGPTGVALTNSTAALRNNNGCTDTNNNASDFTVGAPAPRNSATAVNLCAPASVGENQIAGLRVYPNPITKGTLFIATDANSEKTVAIYDVLGKQVLNTVAAESVNVSGLKGGVYIVKITEDGKTATRKLVIR
ncbi:MAG TPA: T9SS type A sorting domain-containing protein [Flavobacterium sp.]|nr:T9SS type A sorting domain-containing protein [Flavobacterium sp.]